jgi:hypothetical protein
LSFFDGKRLHDIRKAAVLFTNSIKLDFCHKKLKLKSYLCKIKDNAKTTKNSFTDKEYA